MRRASSAIGLIAIWSVPGLIASLTTLLLFPTSPTVGGDVPRFVAISVAPWLVWALLTPMIVALSARLSVRNPGTARLLSTHLVAAILCGAIYVMTAALVSKAALAFWPIAPPIRPGVIVRPMPEEPFWTFVRGFISSRFPIGLIAYATIAGIATAAIEYRARRAREIHTVKLQADLARAELQTLQMRLQPHFLFNTLHTISMLAEENPAAARKMITQLGDLLRETLGLSATPEVPLRTELQLARQYLAIEHTRFGARLETEIVAPDETLDIPVPCFLLQPLIENAMRHGVAPNVDGGRVTVTAARRDGRLHLVVSDDGPGFESEIRSAGIGLATTRDRLALRYGGAATLRWDTAGPGARVQVEIPIANG